MINSAILDQLPIACLWKQLDSRWLGMNNTARDYFLISDVSEYVGKTDSDIEWIKEPEKFIEQDKYIIKGNQSLYFETAYKADSSRHLQICKKSPLIVENSIIGLNCIIFEISMNNFKDISKTLYNAGLRFSDIQKEADIKKTKFCYGGIEFTRRQSQILSLILKGHTAESIGQKLFISRRTVEEHIKNLKDELLCDSKIDIINSAFENGFIDLMFLNIR